MKDSYGWRRAAAAALCAAALAASHGTARVDAAKTDLTVEYDKAFSFAGLRTWAWHPEGPGDVKMVITPNDDPARLAGRVDPIIMPAIERELAARKFVRHPVTDAADLYVHYYVLATVNSFSQVAGQFVAPIPEWGLPAFTASTTAISVYPMGTLLLDISSPALKAIVWRGAARREVNLEKPDDERRKILEKAIADLIKKFPPKK